LTSKSNSKKTNKNAQNKDNEEDSEPTEKTSKGKRTSSRLAKTPPMDYREDKKAKDNKGEAHLRNGVATRRESGRVIDGRVTKPTAQKKTKTKKESKGKVRPEMKRRRGRPQKNSESFQYES
jgi:hypothetical protein